MGRDSALQGEGGQAKRSLSPGGQSGRRRAALLYREHPEGKQHQLAPQPKQQSRAETKGEACTAWLAHGAQHYTNAHHSSQLGLARPCNQAREVLREKTRVVEAESLDVASID